MIFFLEYVGELHIIVLRWKKFYNGVEHEAHANMHLPGTRKKTTKGPNWVNNLSDVVPNIFSELEIRYLQSNTTFEKSKQGTKSTYTAYAQQV